MDIHFDSTDIPETDVTMHGSHAQAAVKKIKFFRSSEGTMCGISDNRQGFERPHSDKRYINTVTHSQPAYVLELNMCRELAYTTSNTIF